MKALQAIRMTNTTATGGSSTSSVLVSGAGTPEANGTYTYVSPLYYELDEFTTLAGLESGSDASWLISFFGDGFYVGTSYGSLNPWDVVTWELDLFGELPLPTVTEV